MDNQEMFLSPEQSEMLINWMDQRGIKGCSVCGSRNIQLLQTYLGLLTPLPAVESLFNTKTALSMIGFVCFDCAHVMLFMSDPIFNPINHIFGKKRPLEGNAP
jgi:hypothetical protein